MRFYWRQRRSRVMEMYEMAHSYNRYYPAAIHLRLRGRGFYAWPTTR